MGYERGTIVLWDLKSRAADVRFQCEHVSDVQSGMNEFDGIQRDPMCSSQAVLIGLLDFPVALAPLKSSRRDKRGDRGKAMRGRMGLS